MNLKFLLRDSELLIKTFLLTVLLVAVFFSILRPYRRSPVSSFGNTNIKTGCVDGVSDMEIYPSRVSFYCYDLIPVYKEVNDVYENDLALKRIYSFVNADNVHRITFLVTFLLLWDAQVRVVIYISDKKLKKI